MTQIEDGGEVEGKGWYCFHKKLRFFLLLDCLLLASRLSGIH